MRSLVTLLLLTGLTTSHLLRRQEFGNDDNNPVGNYFDQVCLPVNATGDPDLNAPCAVNDIISYQCAFGLNNIFSTDNSTDSSDRNETSPATQQICYCESQWFDSYNGCLTCAQKHGVGAAVPSIASSQISSFSSSYCAVSNTPSKGFGEVLASVFGSQFRSVYNDGPKTTTFSDPIGNKTDVSLYYTASVTGSAAYNNNPQASATTTNSGSATRATGSTSVLTSNGEIVATAGQSGGSSRSSGPAALITPCVEKYAFAGVVGIAGAVALL